MTQLKVAKTNSHTAIDTFYQEKHRRSASKELCLKLTSLAREIDTRCTKVLKKHSLTPTRFDILEELLICDAGLTQAEIARRLNVQPANILAALRPLLEKQWVIRKKEERNKKEKMIYFNVEFKNLFQEIITEYYSSVEKLFPHNNPEGLELWIDETRQQLKSS